MTKTFVISTHELYYGAAQALRDYLIKKKTTEVLYIGLPFYHQKEFLYYLFRYGKEAYKMRKIRKKSFGVLDYIIDFLRVIGTVRRERKLYDIFVGFGTLDCLAGVLLKRLGYVRKVIFYSIDFVPIRFENKFFNFVYHMIETLCVKESDEIWNVSPRIAIGREKFLGLSSKKYPQKVVPIGIWYKNIKRRNILKVHLRQLLFAGHLLEKQGVQLVLEAIPRITKEIPDFKFVIIGGGDYEFTLREEVKRLGIEPFVEFKGWISDRKEIDKILSESAAAVAVYKPEEAKLRNFTYYADPTKLKDYLGAGLPIFLTDVPYNAREIEKNECGIVVEYKKNAIAKAVVTLLKDKERLIQYRKNALNYARQFNWDNIFSKILST